MRTRSIASIVAAPAFLERLCMGDGAAALPSLRRVFTGGAPVFPRLLDRLARCVPGARVVALYGSTEAEPIAHFDHRELSASVRERVGTGGGLPAGHPVTEVTLRIIRDSWGTALTPMTAGEFDGMTLGAGAIGEIVVTGDHVLKGYLNGVGDQETKFRVANSRGQQIWHRTGDAGYLDADGFLWLVGRAAAKISDQRGVVYPLQVEAAALGCDGVRRAALVAHDSRRVLLVELVAGAESDAARAELARRLAWAHVERIIPVRAIPMDKRHNAKIDYTALERLLERLPRGQG